ncbi:MAG: hypothetical protein MJE66_03580 [Proteobacteria bacterium]|nr:hypothetical protein [Pseudomonadota bacterium]
MTSDPHWRRCNACKEPIPLRATYFVCSVSTCNRKRTGLAFCSVSCWEVHLPGANHREAWAEERTAPGQRETAAPAPTKSTKTGVRRVVRPQAKPAPATSNTPVPEEVLIVASRLKDYVRARSGFNTSERVLGPLSAIVRRACDEAIEAAARDGRKTVLDRDIPEP